MGTLAVVLLLSLCTAHGRRLRRQTLPSQHIQVHSLHSNVLFDKYITVISSESRIDMTEKNVNGSLWSGHSTVTFDSYDTFVNCSAQQAESFFNLQNSANLYAQGNDINFFMRTNRTQDGHSSIVHDLIGDVNVSIEDSGMQVQGVRGQRAGIEAITWLSSREKSMHIAASTLPNGIRELVLVGATVYVQFGDKIVQIGGDYSSIQIYTDKYSVVAKTNMTPYDVTLTNEEILIRCPNESTMLRVLPSGVDVNVEQLNRLQIERGGGQLSLGSSVIAADSVNVKAMSTDLKLDDSGRVTAYTLNSHIAVQTPVQNVGLTAGHHVIRVDGGAPSIIVESGRSCIEVTSSHGLPQIADLLQPFVTPQDAFAHIGPEQAARLTTLPQEFAEPSFPLPNYLGGPAVFFNQTDRCAACFNLTAANTTKLPSSLTPTFPSKPPDQGLTHTGVSSSTASEPFPTLISLTFPSGTESKHTSAVTKPQTVVSSSETSGVFTEQLSVERTSVPSRVTESSSLFGPEGGPSTVPTYTAEPKNTSDQFVVGQFGEFTGSIVYSGATQATATSPSSLAFSSAGESTVTTVVSLLSSSTQYSNETIPSPLPLPGTAAQGTTTPAGEGFPSPVGISITSPQEPTSPMSGGGGGSWNTETLFPTPSTTLSRKPSVLVLKMKIPSSLDLQSFDLTGNLTAALNEVVKESIRRVKRFKRSLEDKREHVQVHKIERAGNSVRILFSINEIEVDPYMVEKDLSSLDRSYLMQFVGFPVLSTITEIGMDSYLDFIVLGSLALVLSSIFVCYIYRVAIKRMASVIITKVLRLCKCPLTEKVANVTIITDENPIA